MNSNSLSVLFTLGSGVHLFGAVLPNKLILLCEAEDNKGSFDAKTVDTAVNLVQHLSELQSDQPEITHMFRHNPPGESQVSPTVREEATHLITRFPLTVQTH